MPAAVRTDTPQKKAVGLPTIGDALNPAVEVWRGLEGA